MAQIIAQLRSLLSITDLAEILNTSTRTVHRLNSTCRIPSPLRIGGRPRWRRDEIEAWLSAGCPCRHQWERRGQSQVKRMQSPRRSGQ